jgi:hypothetical protein
VILTSSTHSRSRVLGVNPCTGVHYEILGGRGGKRKRQGTVSRVGRWTTRAFKQPHFVIYYMLISGGFSAACFQTIVKGVLDPRISGYDVYADAVYVVICYMSLICICLLYVVILYVICLLYV